MYGVHIGLARTVYTLTVSDRICGGFPAKNTVHTPCIYMVMANPMYSTTLGNCPDSAVVHGQARLFGVAGSKFCLVP